MRPILVTALHNIIIPEKTKKGLSIGNGVRITNNIELLDRDLDVSFHGLVGTIEYSHLKNAKAVCYKYSDNLGKNFDEKYEVVKFIYIVKILQLALWIIKDNNVNCEMAFAKFRQGNAANVHSNFIASVFSKCTGEENVTEYTIEEINLASILTKKLLHEEPEVVKKGTGLKREHNRITIFFYHIQAARAQNDLALKVLSYCTAIESLFSTSTFELTHQLSERIAFFIAESPKERFDIYKSIKEIYKIRSIVAHGETLNCKMQNNLSEICKSCDDFVRKIIAKILTSAELTETFTTRDNSIEKYFLELIFGIQTETSQSFIEDSCP